MLSSTRSGLREPDGNITLGVSLLPSRFRTHNSLTLTPSYIIYISFEVAFVYFIFPETSGKTLEELAFCACFFFRYESMYILTSFTPVFEGDDLRKTQEQAVQDEMQALYHYNPRNLVESDEDISVRRRNADNVT